MYQAFNKWGGGVILAMFGPLGVLTTILVHQDSLHGTFWWLIAGFSVLTTAGVVWLIVIALSSHKKEQPQGTGDDSQRLMANLVLVCHWGHSILRVCPVF